MRKGSELHVSLSRKERPLYLQIKQIIRERILHGEYALGSNIPSEPLLEREFGVSKITVRGAIQELVQEGYLEKGSGRGTRVIRNKAASKLSKWKHFTEILVESGHRIQKRWLAVELIALEADGANAELGDLLSAKEKQKLTAEFGSRCLRLVRMYLLNGQPFIYYIHYVTPLLEGLELMDLSEQSLYELLEEQGLSLDQLQDEFGAVQVPAEAASALGLEINTPVLRRSRTSRDEFGKLIEYSVGFYHTELQSYIVNYEA